MSESRLRIVVTGLIGQYPIGGNAWAYFQWVLGLSRLGHDVFYFEDTGQWPYNPIEGGVSGGCDYNVQYIDSIMTDHGLGERWAYRFPWESQWFGLSDKARAEILSSADLLINVSGTLERPDEYRTIERLAYVDTDPVFTQVKLARGQHDFKALVDAHDVHFTFGEVPSDLVPDTGHNWLPTRQPVTLAEWTPVEEHRDTFTTVMNWTSFNTVSYNGRTYGQKDVEFMKFVDLPQLAAPAEFELAVNSGKTKRTPYDLLKHKGWSVVDPGVVCPDLQSYRNYLRTSFGEWTVAKNGYVEGRSGWFSERSAVYLASGRPVITQDTGFGSVLPVGKGLRSFKTVEEAVEAVRDVRSDHPGECQAARAIAEEYFDSAKVLTSFVERACDR
jgi:hypothetical protein